MQDPSAATSTPRAHAAAPSHVVVMGVAGCGKSSVGERLARALHLPLIEGDLFHPRANVEKMRRGEPLQDADRAGWLQALADELRRHPGGAVLACSALKRSYRDRLRAAAPGLAFVHLRLTPGQARARVAARPGHYYPPGLVDSQFADLEDPAGEPGVVQVDAHQPLNAVAAQALARLGPVAGSSPFNNP